MEMCIYQGDITSHSNMKLINYGTMVNDKPDYGKPMSGKQE